MKFSIAALNKVFDSRIRLGIMAILAVNDDLDFNGLKEYLEVTDGNLASHLKALEKEEYIAVKKSFVGRKPNTKYEMTAKGREAFGEHLKGLQGLIM